MDKDIIIRPSYNGVKFYSPNDLSIALIFKKAESILATFDANKNFEDINEVLELFNIQELFESGLKLNEWSDEFYNGCRKKVLSITSILGRFFARIDDGNFIEYSQKTDTEYIDDFWKLIVRFKVFERISQDVLYSYLQLPETNLSEILVHKELVLAYDKQLADILRISNQTYRILVTQFLENSTVKYYLPENFAPSEYEGVFQKYIDSLNADNADPKLLELIYKSQSTAECPISDRLKLSAKRKCDEYWEIKRDNALPINYSCCISFLDQDELKNREIEGPNYHISYDIKWLKDNLDYPTIMNNYLYVFGMFDLFGRSTLVSVRSKISSIENIFTVKGSRFYQKGIHFDLAAMCSTGQMTIYYKFLKEYNRIL